MAAAMVSARATVAVRPGARSRNAKTGRAAAAPAAGRTAVRSVTGTAGRVIRAGPGAVCAGASAAGSSRARGAVATRAVAELAAAQEVAQLAVYENEIWQTAGITFGCVLLGLSLGFVLLKVESLVEEAD